ncbi:MAG TPA: hypothetical protein PLN33_21620 [Hyphomonadaceae bacterium]|nr:hypothetical protein [Hyphomonadaceae bacterium]HPN05562.1 hypothetical protein [Hyphomonadaceae bacterium]
MRSRGGAFASTLPNAIASTTSSMTSGRIEKAEASSNQDNMPQPVRIYLPLLWMTCSGKRFTAVTSLDYKGFLNTGIVQSAAFGLSRSSRFRR